MTNGRPGYDCVRSDTRRAPIPDLPADFRNAAASAQGNRFATAASLSRLGVVLVVGIVASCVFALTTPHFFATEPQTPTDAPPYYYLAR